MYTISELTYIADQISHAPGTSMYDDIMSAMRQVRDQALEDIAARQAIIERMAQGVNELAAERDALRAQLAAAWHPCEDGSPGGSVRLESGGEWLWVRGDAVGWEIAARLPLDLRLCRRTTS